MGRIYLHSMWIVFCGILLVQSAGYTDDVDRIEFRQLKSLNETGKQFYNNKDYKRAIEQFSKAYKINKNDKIVVGNLISAYIGQAIKEKNIGDFNGAMELLKKALKLDDSIADLHILLASIYLSNGDYTLAEGELKIAQIYTPHSMAIMSMLGETAFQKGDLEAAIQYWAVSQEKQPYNQTINMKIDRAKREWEIQKNYLVMSSHPFKIKYKKENKVLAENIMAYLQEGYVEIGRIFHYFPLSEVIVIIYDPKDFYAVTTAQKTITGLYDGKIRVKVSSRLDDQVFLRKVVLHEYTHVLIRFLTNDTCPFWLNEGLAQVVSGPVAHITLDDLNNLDLESVHFKLHKLERFQGLRKGPDFHLDMNASVKLAYLKSFLATSYLVQQYGIKKIRGILSKLKRTYPIEKAVKNTVGLDLKDIDNAVQTKILTAKDKILEAIELHDKILLEQKVANIRKITQ